MFTEHLTPEQKHRGEDVNILSKRQRTYEARAKHPERWTRKIRNWSPVEVIHLNPASSSDKISLELAA
jgi:hypothetical protein